jgi:hypothetical protein
MNTSLLAKSYVSNIQYEDQELKGSPENEVSLLSFVLSKLSLFSDFEM